MSRIHEFPSTLPSSLTAVVISPEKATGHSLKFYQTTMSHSLIVETYCPMFIRQVPPPFFLKKWDRFPVLWKSALGAAL